MQSEPGAPGRNSQCGPAPSALPPPRTSLARGNPTLGHISRAARQGWPRRELGAAGPGSATAVSHIWKMPSDHGNGSRLREGSSGRNSGKARPVSKWLGPRASKNRRRGRVPEARSGRSASSRVTAAHASTQLLQGWRAAFEVIFVFSLSRAPHAAGAPVPLPDEELPLSYS